MVRTIFIFPVWWIIRSKSAIDRMGNIRTIFMTKNDHTSYYWWGTRYGGNLSQIPDVASYSTIGATLREGPVLDLFYTDASNNVQHKQFVWATGTWSPSEYVMPGPFPLMPASRGWNRIDLVATMPMNIRRTQWFEPSGIGVFRSSTHTFYLDYNRNGAWNGAISDRAYNFGLTGDMPVSGDWNLDGISEIGVFRPSSHTFYLDYNRNGAWNGAISDRAYNFGLTGDIPVSGDWNLDGKTEIGVFRPSSHIFYLDYDGNGAWNGAISDRAHNFGLTGDIPVSGDWNLDGKLIFGVLKAFHTYVLHGHQRERGMGWNGDRLGQ